CCCCSSCDRRGRRPRRSKTSPAASESRARSSTARRRDSRSGSAHPEGDAAARRIPFVLSSRPRLLPDLLLLLVSAGRRSRVLTPFSIKHRPALVLRRRNFCSCRAFGSLFARRSVSFRRKWCRTASGPAPGSADEAAGRERPARRRVHHGRRVSHGSVTAKPLAARVGGPGWYRRPFPRRSTVRTLQDAQSFRKRGLLRADSGF